MIELHGFPMSPNARRARFMLEELEVPYRFVNVDLMSGEQKGDAYKALNPTARVPTLVDGELKLWESNAIILYLAEKHAEKKLGGEDVLERAEIGRWMFMNAAHMSPAVSRIFAHTMRLPADQRIPRIVEESKAELARCLAPLDAHLAGKEYLLGRFTVADVALVPALAFAPMLGIDLAATPNVAAWVKCVTARAAWKKTD